MTPSDPVRTPSDGVAIRLPVTPSPRHLLEGRGRDGVEDTHERRPSGPPV
jgi:hypothetical protein